MGGSNIQNLLRPVKEVSKNLDLAIKLVKTKDLEGIRKEFKTDPLELVGSLIRSCFIASPGKKLLVCDLSAVENRVLGYIARDETILEPFRLGRDPYLNFASKMYKIPYESLITINEKGEHKPKDSDAVEKRQNSKPPVLGCLGIDTPVLTNKGWKPIQNITSIDKVFDGDQFVFTDGVIYKGKKETIDLFGVSITPDHEILLPGERWEIALNIGNTLIGQQATSLASGKLLNLLNTRMKDTISADVVDADLKSRFTSEIWKKEKLTSVLNVQTGSHSKNAVAFTSSLDIYREILLIDWLTAITQYYRDVEVLDTPHIDTKEGVFPVNLKASMTLWTMLYLSQVMTTLFYSLIGKIITDTTSEAIYGLYLRKLITIIKKFSDMLSGTERNCLQPNFGRNTVQDIEQIAQSLGNLEKDCPQNRLSKTSPSVEVPTFDILNAGPKNRYMILTNRGPLIVHNCGYMLSAGEKKTTEEGDVIYTGLMGYARNMSIEMEQQLCVDSVQAFRSTHKDVVKCWDNLEKAAMKCIKDGKQIDVGPIRFDVVDGVLRMVLPSGRALHYLDPKIVEKDWYGGKKETIEICGMDQKKHIWTRIYTYSGKLMENGDQAISRDQLAHGMLNARKSGMDIVMTTHDEIVAEVPDKPEYSVEMLRQCMIDQPPWADKYWLMDAAGFETKIYRKD